VTEADTELTTGLCQARPQSSISADLSMNRAPGCPLVSAGAQAETPSPTTQEPAVGSRRPKRRRGLFPAARRGCLGEREQSRAPRLARATVLGGVGSAFPPASRAPGRAVSSRPRAGGRPSGQPPRPASRRVRSSDWPGSSAADDPDYAPACRRGRLPPSTGRRSCTATRNPQFRLRLDTNTVRCRRSSTADTRAGARGSRCPARSAIRAQPGLAQPPLRVATKRTAARGRERGGLPRPDCLADERATQAMRERRRPVVRREGSRRFPACRYVVAAVGTDGADLPILRAGRSAACLGRSAGLAACAAGTRGSARAGRRVGTNTPWVDPGARMHSLPGQQSA